MIARATTTISILRGETADEYGDDEPNNVPVYTGIPASIIERSRQVFTADAPAPRVVRYVTGRVGAANDVRADDMILDERTQVRYMVEGVQTNANPVIRADLKLNLVEVQDK